ncbi:MAG: SPFH domain-containing protein [Planctomycetota bacterium]
MTQPTAPPTSDKEANAALDTLPPAVVTDVDAQTRGFQAAGIGFVVQLLSVVGMFVLAGVGSQLNGLIYFTAAGVIIWAAIALTYAFRRQAAVENVEVEEALRRGQTEQSIFADMADARPAARRVRRVYNYLLPSLAGIAGGALVTVGSINLVSAIQTNPEVFEPEALSAAGVAAVLAVLAFLGFVAGRYAIGLSRTDSHKLLRAGGVYLVGTCVLLFLGAIAYGVLHLGTGEQKVVLPVKILIFLMPAVCIVVGAEFLLNLLLDQYRPRRRGEEPRASFESRLLGLFGAPGGVVASLNEAINYQFGFEITQSWFWRLIAKNFVWLLLFGVTALLAISSIYIVEPQQKAVVTFAGRPTHTEPIEPGIGVKWPWPLGTIETYDVERLRTVQIASLQGVTPNAQLEGPNRREINRTPALFDNRGTETDNLLLLSADFRRETDTTRTANDGENEAPAVALAGAEIHVNYRIADLMQYVRTNPTDIVVDGEPDDPLFRAIVEQVTHEEMMKVRADALLGTGRAVVAERIKRSVDARASAAGLGLEVTWVGIAGVHPAQQVADAFFQGSIAEAQAAAEIERARAEAIQFFSEVAGSQAKAQEIIEAIEKLRATTDPEAEAEQRAVVEDLIENANGAAAQLLVAATAERFRLELGERGRVAEFQGQLTAYRAAPEYFKTTQWLEALSENLPEARQFLSTIDAAEIRPVLDFESLNRGGINLNLGG